MNDPAPTWRAPEGTGPGLVAHVRRRLGTLLLDARFVVGPGEVVAVVGPNGAGKTSLLRALAGLEPLDGGRVALDGVVLEDTAAGVRAPPAGRHVGVVFQDHLLFPHLSALENVAFGPRSTGATRADARAAAAGWLRRVGLGEHAHERPAALSGGQAQRVAVARALARAPRLLLLDEPTAALDVAARRVVRAALREHLAAFDGPTVLVTHDPLEALTLADRLVVLEAGRVVQDAPPRDVARHPRSEWAARLVGLNLYRGTASDDRVLLDEGGEIVLDGRPAGGPTLAVVHPRSVTVHAHRPSGSPRNSWPGTVAALDVHHDSVRVDVAGTVDVVAQITPAALAELDLREGSPVWIAFKASEVAHYPA